MRKIVIASALLALTAGSAASAQLSAVREPTSSADDVLTLVRKERDPNGDLILEVRNDAGQPISAFGLYLVAADRHGNTATSMVQEQDSFLGSPLLPGENRVVALGRPNASPDDRQGTAAGIHYVIFADHSHYGDRARVEKAFEIRRAAFREYDAAVRDLSGGGGGGLSTVALSHREVRRYVDELERRVDTDSAELATLDRPSTTEISAAETRQRILRAFTNLEQGGGVQALRSPSELARDYLTLLGHYRDRARASLRASDLGAATDREGDLR